MPTRTSEEAAAAVAREWAERQREYADPVIPEPVERARRIDFRPTWTRTGNLKTVTFSDDLPSGAVGMVKKMLRSKGWTIHVTRAVGTWTGVDGVPASRAIMEAQDGLTSTGRQKMAKIGEVPLEPQVSVLVRGVGVDSAGITWMVWGHWLGSQFESGGEAYKAVDGRIHPRPLGWLGGVAERAERHPNGMASAE